MRLSEVVIQVEDQGLRAGDTITQQHVLQRAVRLRHTVHAQWLSPSLLLVDESAQVRIVNHRLISVLDLGRSEGVNNCQFMFQSQAPIPPWLR